MAENGWISMSGKPEFGGQGLPAALSGMVSEFFTGANLAFMSYPGLTSANADVIEHFGTDQDREMFVEKLNTGVFAGTMCLTEPDAGSDAGHARTKAGSGESPAAAECAPARAGDSKGHLKFLQPQDETGTPACARQV